MHTAYPGIKLIEPRIKIGAAFDFRNQGGKEANR